MRFRFLMPVAAVLGVLLGVIADSPTARAGVFPGQVITSAGPLSQIFIANDLGCQVAYIGDASFQFFPSGSEQGNCGTFLYVGSTLYGQYGSWGTGNEFTPVSQTAVTGSGTSGSPYQVVTVVDAGTTGFRITQTDSYVVGDEFYRTDIQVANTTGSSAAIKLYRGADCYLGGSDSGYGFLDASGGVVGCTVNPNNVPSGRVELWTPITAVSFYGHAGYSTIRSFITSGSDLPNTCLCTTQLDNGAGIQWNATINGGASSTYSHYTTFSPTGVGAPTPTPGGPTNTPASGTGTPTEETAPKTHTPTPAPTDAPTDTVVPTTDTPVPVITQAPASPPPSGGNQGGSIAPPNTGSGGDRSVAGLPARFGLALAIAVAVAGTGVWFAAARARE